jgi:hypothetical protein
MIIILLAFGAGESSKVINGDIKSIITTESRFNNNNQSLDLNQTKEFNFGFGTSEPVPLRMGQFFAEFLN